MTPFTYNRVMRVEDAATASLRPGAMLLAGGTTLIDLMRGTVLAPTQVIDIGRIPGLDRVEERAADFRFGSLSKMADVAEHPILRRDYPALTEALQLAASQQLRNMATLGGNLLQRTRCPYYRDARSACNKRNPGSGCPALDGANRDLAILGTSDSCIATYPGDFAVVLVAFDARIEIVSPQGRRELPVEQLHREPADTPERDTNLAPGDVITAIIVPKTPLGRKSTYLKIRDRQSYAFAIASAAVALHMDGDRVSAARIAVGGVATKPWRSRAAEASLVGRRLNETSALEAGRAVFADARTRGGNRHKPEIGARAVARALLTAAARGEQA